MSSDEDRPPLKRIKKEEDKVESRQKLSPNWARLVAKQKQQHDRDKIPPRKSKNHKREVEEEEPVFIDSAGEMSRIMEQVVSSNKVPESEEDEGRDQELVPLGPGPAKDYFEDYLDDKRNKAGKYIAIDCEFVGCGPGGSRSALARVSIVNLHGAVVLDLYVRPQEKVTDWRTWVSGVSPRNMKNAVDFKEAQYRVYDILNGGDGLLPPPSKDRGVIRQRAGGSNSTKKRILIGHAIHHDLKSLQIDHPQSLTRDTARAKFLRQALADARQAAAAAADPLQHTTNNNNNNAVNANLKGVPSLRNLSRLLLNHDIQNGQHSSVQDAQATMFVFRRFKHQFDELYAKYNRLVPNKQRQ